MSHTLEARHAGTGKVRPDAGPANGNARPGEDRERAQRTTDGGQSSTSQALAEALANAARNNLRKIIAANGAAPTAAHATVRVEAQGRPVAYRVSLTRLGGGA